jgi:outer membrane lipoprotein carrier protein
VCLSWPTLHAQTPSAVELAKQVDQHYNQLRSLRAQFTEQYDGLGMHRSESGTLLLEKPGHMRWDYQSQPGKLFVLDGKHAWFYAPGETQVQRIPAAKLDDLRSPLRFLLGHTRIENELEGLTSTRSNQAGSAGEYQLSGVPKGQQKRITSLTLSVLASGAITAIEIREVDGATTQFFLTHEEPNASLPKDAFHFTPPAGIPVVDALPPV